MATTLEAFESLVFQYARSHGQPFIKWQERAELRAFINRELQSINEEKKLLYDDNITFDTTSTDSGAYNLMLADTYLSVSKTAAEGTNTYVQILEPEFVFIEDAVLVGTDGMPGLVSVDEGTRWPYDYRTVADAQPQYAALLPPSTLRLIPAPNAAYDVTISGWIQHFDLTEDGIADTKALWLDAGSVKGAAMAIAGELIYVGAEGPAIQAALTLVERGKSQLSKASSRAAAYLQGPQVRGRSTGMYRLD